MIVTSYGQNKNLDEIKNSRTSPDVQFQEFSLTKQKLDLEWTMTWENHSEKYKKTNLKNSKNRCQNATFERKTTSEKANFCSNTILSLCSKTLVNNVHAAKPIAFSLHFQFRCDQNHYSNLTLKIMKMCEQIFKKDSAPIQ